MKPAQIWAEAKRQTRWRLRCYYCAPSPLSPGDMEAAQFVPTPAGSPTGRSEVMVVTSFIALDRRATAGSARCQQWCKTSCMNLLDSHPQEARQARLRPQHHRAHPCSLLCLLR